MSDDTPETPTTDALVPRRDTEDVLAERRRRRRDVQQRQRVTQFRPKGDGRPLDIETLGDPHIDDPPEYLESIRTNLIKSLLIDASETSDRELRAKICVHLLKFTSMGRGEKSQERPHDDLPDLSQLLTEAQLATLAAAPEEALSDLAQRLSQRKADEADGA